MYSDLLNNIFQKEIKTDGYINGKSELAYSIKDFKNRCKYNVQHINIHHLAYIAKQWLRKENKCEIDIHIGQTDTICTITKFGLNHSSFKGSARTETEAFFKACKSMIDYLKKKKGI